MLIEMPPNSPAMVKSLSDIRKLADDCSATELSYNHQSRVISFKTVHNARVNVYFTTGTVSTALEHPKAGKTQLFRRDCKLAQLSEIFRDPRVHTGKGYYEVDKQKNPQNGGSSLLGHGVLLDEETALKAELAKTDAAIAELSSHRENLLGSLLSFQRRAEEKRQADAFEEKRRRAVEAERVAQEEKRKADARAAEKRKADALEEKRRRAVEAERVGQQRRDEVEKRRRAEQERILAEKARVDFRGTGFWVSRDFLSEDVSGLLGDDSARGISCLAMMGDCGDVMLGFDGGGFTSTEEIREYGDINEDFFDEIRTYNGEGGVSFFALGDKKQYYVRFANGRSAWSMGRKYDIYGYEEENFDSYFDSFVQENNNTGMIIAFDGDEESGWVGVTSDNRFSGDCLALRYGLEELLYSKGSRRRTVENISLGINGSYFVSYTDGWFSHSGLEHYPDVSFYMKQIKHTMVRHVYLSPNSQEWIIRYREC